MSDQRDQTDAPDIRPDVNSTGSDVGQEDIPWAAVDSGQSDDIESPLQQQGVADRQQIADVRRTESNEIAADELTGDEPASDEG
ncbi:MAG: hypothetical protein HY996_09705 [Micrococcales bacterium]|nr:hypothetical protein [Micrococcales bacterium]